MTYRQKVLKTVYPVFMWWSRLVGNNSNELVNSNSEPVIPFYTLKGFLNNGNELDFTSLKGKKVLLVNTASDCGYTDQYAELEKLYEKYNNSLVIIGFPSNDFKQQENGTDEEIAQFCKLNFGISFPMMKKSVVIKSDQQNEVFRWLTDLSLNGWNNKQPTWNFCKYLVNENGVLTNYFGSAVSPLSKDVIKAIEKKL
ncbi:MAG: glutathione peroxidase [Bacteroidetes bacterium]|nr:glutathione peroxidase [Bacteroidota bacterium]MBS1931998.1 glutathione peroxidase [Bacteroidota bacterium]